MKLATRKDGTRDGVLVVVSTDLRRCTPVGRIAGTLQRALDGWGEIEPLLREVHHRLDLQQIAGEPFDEAACMSPLPRAYQWADGSAYLNHVELVRRARGAEMPDALYAEPLIYQGGSDAFLGPRDPIPVLQDEGWGIDFEAEVAVVVDDVPMGTTALAAREHVKLVMLVNDVSLRGLIPDELEKGFGFYQSKPSSTFSPVAATPDVLGAAWADAKLHLAVRSSLNGTLFGKPNAGVDMSFDFGQIIAHAARTRPLGAGTIIGSGTVSNKLDGGPGKPVKEDGVGYSCIAELRTIESIEKGAATAPFLRFGDRVRIEALDEHDGSVFGAIDQEVVRI